MQRVSSLFIFSLFIACLSACSGIRVPVSFSAISATQHELKKDYAGAVKLYDQLIEKYPKDNKLLTSRGHCKYHLYDYAGAIQDFDKAIELNPLDGRAFDLKGLCEYRLKRYKESIIDFEKAIKIDPQNAHTHEDLSDCYKQINNLQKAESHLLKAKTLYTKHGGKNDLQRIETALSALKK